MDDACLEIKEVKTAMDTLKHISANDDIRAMVDLRQRNINDRNSEETIALEKEKAEREAKGKSEGEAKKARETAMKLLGMELTKEQI